MQTVTTHASLHMCTDSPEPLLLANAINFEILCTGTYEFSSAILLNFVQVFNTTEEVNDAMNYPYLRLFMSP